MVKEKSNARIFYKNNIANDEKIGDHQLRWNWKGIESKDEAAYVAHT